LAFTDRVGEWNFSDWRAQGDKAVLGGDLSTLIIARAPDFYVTEKMIVQVTSGQDFGLCRQTTSVTTNGNNDLVIGLDRPLGRHISVGEKVTIFSNTNELFFGGSF
jgi:glycine/serine hydroxymethyltransferase